MSTPNFSEIAARMAAGSDDVRACLIVSGDGLTLGVFPEDREEPARAAWGRMVASGDPEPERGFVVVGEEIWAFMRRGGYGAMTIAARAVRPGLLLDALDGALKDLHQERTERAPAPAAAASKAPAAETRDARRPTEPARRGRTAMHPEPRRERRETPRTPGPPVRRLAPEDVEEPESAPVEQAPAEREPAARVAERSAPVDVPVDTLELTREFGGLLDGPGGR
jgi:hypothetical protein